MTQEKEFNLSEKIWYPYEKESESIRTNDVKEFIKILLDYFNEDFEQDFIKRKVGDKLI